MCIRVILLLLAALPCLAQTPTKDESLKKAIESMHQRYLDCLKRGDAQSFAELFTTDGQIFNPGIAAVSGRENILRDRQELFIRAKVLSGVIRTDHLEQSGDLAFELGRFSYTLSVDGQPGRIVEGKFITIWKRGEDGQWRYRVDAGLPN